MIAKRLEAPYRRASARCSRSSTSERPTASWPGSAGTRTGRARMVGSLLLGLFDDEGSSTTSGSPPRSRWPAQAELVDRAGAVARARAWMAIRGRNGRSGPMARPKRPVSGCPARRVAGTAGKDLSWEPLRPERVVRGGVRPPAGRSVPARDDVRALATGQAARGLPLRPAGETPAYELWSIFGTAER